MSNERKLTSADGTSDAAGQKHRILAIVGPTGGGKSALALRLARDLDGVIISCDSMQVYRRMDVGTAKPTADEQRLVCHRMIDLVDPHDDYSCAQYVAGAAGSIEMTVAEGRLPIVCGGTGLYLDALLRENELPEVEVPEGLRQALQKEAERRGAHEMWLELASVDPESASATHENNVKRVLRALEIFRATGIPKSEHDRRSREGGDRYDACVIGLYYPDRQVLYRRIDRRVDQMIRDGLVEETRRLDGEGVFEVNRTAAQAIGYKELLPYCRGEAELSECAEKLKTATRRYAKRQMTWFQAKSYVRWIAMTEENGQEKTFEEIVNNAKQLFQNA